MTSEVFGKLEAGSVLDPEPWVASSLEGWGGRFALSKPRPRNINPAQPRRTPMRRAFFLLIML